MFVKLSAALLAAVLAGSANANANIFARAACNADNCARAVTGTKVPVPTATRKADCSAFQAVTISYVGFAGTTTTISSTDAEALPTYAASQCGYDVSRFDSACSCWGVPKTTQTAYPFPCTNGQVVTDDNGCGYTATCYSSLSGSVIDYRVGQGYYGECAEFCDQSAECVAFSFAYFSGDCLIYKAGYGVVPNQLGSTAYVRNDLKCTGPNAGGGF